MSANPTCFLQHEKEATMLKGLKKRKYLCMKIFSEAPADSHFNCLQFLLNWDISKALKLSFMCIIIKYILTFLCPYDRFFRYILKASVTILFLTNTYIQKYIQQMLS